MNTMADQNDNSTNLGDAIPARPEPEPMLLATSVAHSWSYRTTAAQRRHFRWAAADEPKG